jgi:hypothetical protein
MLLLVETESVGQKINEIRSPDFHEFEGIFQEIESLKRE